MTYATQQDLIDRFSQAELAQLTDPAAGTTIDPVPVARALADADAEVDSYLGARYSLPLANVPTVLVRVAADIARYRLWDQAAPDLVKDRYREAVKLLQSLARGETVLAGAVALAPADGAITVTVASRSRQFSSDTLDRFARPS